MNDLLDQMSQRVLRHARENHTMTPIPRLAIGYSRDTRPMFAPVGPGICVVL